MIVIDTREQFKEEIQEKLTKLNVPSVITKLEDYTDYLLVSDNEEVENIMAIQRKTIAEVLSKEPSKQGYKSMMDEIRDRIVNETKAKYEDTWLLVEDGGLRVSADAKIMLNRGKLLYETGLSVKSYYNFLHSLEDKAIRIKTVPNLEYSIWWLYSIHARIQRHHYPKPSRKYSEDEEIMGALMGVPGIGEKKAQKIYEQYVIISTPVFEEDEESDEKPSPNTTLPIDEEKSNSGDVVKSDGIFPCAISEIASLQKIVSDEEREEIKEEIDEEMEELEKEIEREFGSEILNEIDERIEKLEKKK